MKREADSAVIEQLRKQILSLQGSKVSGEQSLSIGLSAIESSFAGSVFPRASIHQFISSTSENAASTCGFVSVILGKLMQQGGSCLWISTGRNIFPPALKFFGIEPSRILFVDTGRAKHALWAIEEALKCDALVAVVGELGDIDFNKSRRLQLAVERSKVTGFIHCYKAKSQNATACVTRWKITPVQSESVEGMPGLGFPRWNVELQKVRNGKPGSWKVRWSPKGLEFIDHKLRIIPQTYERPTG